METRFGEFVLDAAARELRRAGARVHLSPKAYELLAMLVENRPRALSKAVLKDRLWPDTHVVEANLSNLVGEIRSALGDDARAPTFIRTVQGFGYAFERVAGVAEKAAESRVSYRLTWRGGATTLRDGEHVLGRDPELQIPLDSATVSRRHALIRIAGGEATLEDLRSKNGTFLNERRLEGPQRLADGDSIRLGAVRLTVRQVGHAASTKTVDPIRG